MGLGPDLGPAVMEVAAPLAGTNASGMAKAAATDAAAKAARRVLSAAIEMIFNEFAPSVWSTAVE